MPYLIGNPRGQLIELPSHYGLDDWPQYQFAREFQCTMPIKAPSEGMAVFREEFDAAWEYGGLWVAVWHPFLAGRLARAREIRSLIEHMQRKGGVWFATLEQIATHIQTLMDCGQWTPRRDTIPYLEGPIPELGDAPGGQPVR